MTLKWINELFVPSKNMFYNHRLVFWDIFLGLSFITLLVVWAFFRTNIYQKLSLFPVVDPRAASFAEKRSVNSYSLKGCLKMPSCQDCPCFLLCFNTFSNPPCFPSCVFAMSSYVFFIVDIYGRGRLYKSIWSSTSSNKWGGLRFILYYSYHQRSTTKKVIKVREYFFFYLWMKCRSP